MANMSPAIHPETEPPTVAIPTVMKNKIPKETDFDHAYEVVVALELEYKNIKFSVTPNLVGDLILSPQDHNTAKILSEVTNLNGKTIKIIPLDPEEQTTRMVLLRYPLELPVEVIIKHPKVTKAELCVKSRDKAQTRQMLVDIKGNTKTEPSRQPKLWKETSRLEHIMPREERADKSCNGKSSTTKQNRSTSDHIRVGSTASEYSQPNTHSAPTVRGFLPCTTPPGYRTKLKTPGQNQSMQETMTNQWTPQPQLQSCVQNTPVLVENTILPRTLQPLQATTQLNTPPACQSTSGIHRRTNKTDDHYYDSDFLYDNAETRYQHRKYNKCSYDTAHRKDAGRPDPLNSTTTSGTDDALETDIRQEEELVIQEITQNRETSSPSQQITRNRTTSTDRQQTLDHRQERQHPEERRKNSRGSTSCSSLRAGAQETATTPNGRGGE
ncbi:putative RNA-directed DNA polymerase from mobile element jockey-like 97 [Homarus americanus]|uniref:Putative RNA-directed DNA polymerase from mobile element jockey-like 97 n=1 Tax=Homarus americanus TaxID=6706 RepID=A0A8J5JNA3_HOMAM|nr:putative RNA-directed DNA polymerase from mobile element jockey-like 97 [Homarus americanus]